MYGEGVQIPVTAVDEPTVVNAFSPRTIADRLNNLFRSLKVYDLQSNGTEEELLGLVPGGGGASGISALSDDAVMDLCRDVVSVLQRRELESALRVHGIPHALYPVGAEPQAEPPHVRLWDPPVVRDVSSPAWSLLGMDVGFPVGIPACELTSSAEWIDYYGRRSFHILTYRTVRTERREGSPYDWVFVNGIRQPWSSAKEAPRGVDGVNGSIPPDLRTMSTATSFMVPSPPVREWKADVAEARRKLDALGGGHMLIVSVTDSVPLREKTPERLVEDFTEVVQLALAAGADAVECYLARAGVRKESGERAPCESNVETSLMIMREVRRAVGREARLLVKLSASLTDAELEGIIEPLARERVINGVSGISPVEIDVVTTGAREWCANGHRPAVAGYALRRLGEDFVRRVAAIRRQHDLDFDIIAMGGVMSAEDVVNLMGLGASAVQSATAAMMDGNLARSAVVAYRKSVEAEPEVWDGFVLTVDHERQQFRARVRLAERDEDFETTFGFDEVIEGQRNRIKPGVYLRWTTTWVEEGRRRVRTSTLGLVDPPPTDPAVEAANVELAERVRKFFDAAPGIA